MKILSNRHGFTFIELLVVISIIAILAMIANVNYTEARGKARDAKRIADINQLRALVEVDAAGSIDGIYETVWSRQAIRDIYPPMDTAYCYYTSADQGAYLLMVVGMEGADLAALGSPVGEVPMQTPAPQNVSKVRGAASCPPVTSVDRATEITAECARTNAFCLVGFSK